ncbi:sensor domain-containing diguanylate cyclase, partial [Fervidobacterium thailandense]
MLRDKIKKYNILATLAFLSSLTLIVMFVSFSVRKSFSFLEEFYGQSVDHLLESYSLPMKTVCKDYSLWDELYNFVLQPNEEFAKTNLSISYHQLFKVDFVAVIRDTELVFFESNDSRIKGLLVEKLNAGELKKSTYFFEWPEWITFPIEIVSYPICKSADLERTNPAGWLVMGNIYDVQDLTNLENLSGTRITFTSIGEKEPRQRIGELTYKKPIKNSKGEIIGYIHSMIEFKTFRHLVNSMIILVLLLTVFVIVFLTLVTSYLSSYLIKPFANIVYAIENNTTDPLEQYTVRDDEIGQLAQAVKHYLIQKEQINVYLKELESKNLSLRKLNEEVRRLLEKDPLTGLLTRFVFNSQIERLYVSSKADRMPLSAIAIDADNFKKINDTYGHQKGDEVLQKIGKIIIENTRMSDFPIRMGGEEILILLPQAD